MRAVVLDEGGAAEQLAVRDVPEPVAGDGQTIVDVRASAINFVEILVRQGRYPQMPPLPWIPGGEVAGVVGDRRVLALGGGDGGGYAERMAVPDALIFDLPDDASFEEGAAFLLSFLTAWIPLTRQAQLEAGSRVLVTAAAGGTGCAAVQAAVALGAEVVAAVGSPEKRDLPLSLGASEAVTYGELSDVAAVDVVFDLVGGDLFASSVKMLRPLGVTIGIGFAGGWWQPVDPAELVGRNVGVQGFYLGRLMRFRPDVVRVAAEELLEMWRGGRVRPIVGATYPLDGAAEAHRAVEERRTTGKVVLVP